MSKKSKTNSTNKKAVTARVPKKKPIPRPRSKVLRYQGDVAEYFCYSLRGIFNSFVPLVDELGYIDEKKNEAGVTLYLMKSEYSLRECYAGLSLVNYMEENFNLNQLLVDKSIPDLREMVIRAAVLYYRIFSYSGLSKLALTLSKRGVDVESGKKEILNSGAMVICDILNSEQIGIAVDHDDVSFGAAILNDKIDSLEDEQSKYLIEYAKAVSKGISMGNIIEVMSEANWIQNVNHLAISKLIFKELLFSHLRYAERKMLGGADGYGEGISIVKRLNIAMIASYTYSALASENTTLNDEIQLNDSITTLLGGSGFPMMFLEFDNFKKREEFVLFEYVQSEFAGIAAAYNADLVPAINKIIAGKRAARGIEYFSELSEKDIQDIKDKLKRMVHHHGYSRGALAAMKYVEPDTAVES